MLSFDVSAIDVVLVVAVLILLSLYVTRKTGTPKTEPKQQIEMKHKVQENPQTTTKIVKSKTPQLQAGFQSCVHHFGYLKGLEKNKAVPDECFGCPKVMQCLFPKE
jgi:hypothetical protein